MRVDFDGLSNRVEVVDGLSRMQGMRLGVWGGFSCGDGSWSGSWSGGSSNETCCCFDFRCGVCRMRGCRMHDLSGRCGGTSCDRCGGTSRCC